MLKFVFIDFYGTLVHEDDEIIKEITEAIFKSGNAEKQSDISCYWWNCFRGLFKEAKGDAFKTQRELEVVSLQNTISYFNSDEDAVELSKRMFEFWQKPVVFKDAGMFFEKCPVPVIIISNIDTQDIIKAIEYHGFNPYRIVTSEEAKSYKPQKEIFKYTLKKYNILPNEVIHIGDSFANDVLGAKAAEIGSVWVNRSGKPVPESADTVVSNLNEVFELKCFK